MAHHLPGCGVVRGLYRRTDADGCRRHLAGGWPKGEYDRFLSAQNVDRTKANVGTGTNGAVTVAYNGIAARAGLEALAKGGNARS